MNRFVKPCVWCAAVLGLYATVGAAGAFAADDEVVEFRLEKWKTAHFDTAKEADTFTATMKKLGCESKQEAHDGHIDVQYRCPKWLSLKAESHDAAHKWEKWLKSKGFETKHDD